MGCLKTLTWLGRWLQDSTTDGTTVFLSKDSQGSIWHITTSFLKVLDIKIIQWLDFSIQGQISFVQFPTQLQKQCRPHCSNNSLKLRSPKSRSWVIISFYVSCESDACEEEMQLSETRWLPPAEHGAVPMGDAGGFWLPWRLSFVHIYSKCYGDYPRLM